MAVRVGINGFGRIGRNILRAGLFNPAIKFVAVNDLADRETLAHLLKYDSVLGRFGEDVSVSEDGININGEAVRVFAEMHPSNIDWESVGAEVVIEATGHFARGEDARQHLRGGVKKVIVSAPAADEDVTVVLGVNECLYDPRRHHVISNASCTTNCIAPVAKVLHEQFGIRAAQVTTVHSYTNGQNLLDLPHRDWRRGRAAALSMIPTTTSAAKLVPKILPELKGKFDAIGVRVPTPNVSLIDLAAAVERETTAEEVNAALRRAAGSELHGILAFSEEPLVSVDFRRNPHSAIVDAEYTKVIGRLVKILAWYDNEWGYSSRVIDLVRYIAECGFRIAD
jgi:glyceraldehyde 3-phosphate dehydrogenase